MGKSKIPNEILNKSGPLTKEEWDIMKKHPQWGYEILMETGDMTEEAAHIVLEHHERANGSGYPSGKKGDEIHIYARICAIADAYDALTAERSYKSAKRPFDALKLMQEEMAQEFDPEFFAAFVMLFAPPNYNAHHMTSSSSNLV
ncbi:MAG: HD domain-containing protein [Deltaproteobacteria bacterium]|nr:HD domain-containing protein [Deltaproteobacteria bacterium]